MTRLAITIIISLLTGVLQAAESVVTWEVDGQRREALVFLPNEATDAPAPVVFVFHGHGGAMRTTARRFRIHELWPEAIVVVPQGLNTPGKYDPQGRKPGWQKTVGDQDDRDLKLVDTIPQTVRSRHRVDDTRICATGHSNGGGFTYLVALARPGVFAAIAPSAAGAGGVRGIRDRQPLPVFHLAGRKDTVVPFDGQMQTVQRIREFNRCEPEATAWASGCLHYSSSVGAPVVTFIHDGAHGFPPVAPPLIVRFYREHRRPVPEEQQETLPRVSDDPAVDVVVYSATPAGIAAAIEAARSGASVTLIEPTAHIGGMTTSGLSHPDFRTFEGLTGFYLDFTERVRQHYIDVYGADSQEVRDCLNGTHAEPHVNEQVFTAMLQDCPSVRVLHGVLADVKVDGNAGANNAGTEIRALELRTGEGLQSIPAKLFIDASYDGDVMARAGVEYTVGREGREVYDEALAEAESDAQLQAYNFRFVATQNPSLRVPVEQPASYDRSMFAELIPLLSDGSIDRVFGYPTRCIFKAQIPALPHGKHDINDVSRAPVRLSLPGENLAWPDGTPAERDAVFQAHLTYNAGLLWFLQHDSEVPAEFREEALQWGWCRDEFVDNHHLPWQLYVRESRRMIGARVLTQRDTESHKGSDVRAWFQADAIAMGDYGPNCHGTSHEGARFGGKHTGEFYQRAAPYQIPYGVLLPQRHTNLLVPVACSASHVGYCAIRLEPIWASLGQAAGTAARIAVTRNQPVRNLPPSDIRAELHAHGAATVYVSDIPRTSRIFEAVQWLGSAGGLHGLHNHEGNYGQRGDNLIGQYYATFPDHAFQPDREIDQDLWHRWTELAQEVQPAAAIAAAKQTPRTRGEAAAILFDAAKVP